MSRSMGRQYRSSRIGAIKTRASADKMAHRDLGTNMKRRDLATFLGAAAAWPLAARAQQPSMPVIGFLFSGGPPNRSTLVALGKGLGEMGFVEGRNVTIELHGTAQYDQFPVLAAELVRRQ